MFLNLDEVYINSKSEKLLTDVELNINSYGIYLICGKNGSGKTTFAKSLFKKYRHLISMMLQENDLVFMEESILDNINMHQDKKAKILNLLNEHNLAYLLDKNPKYLSGGEKRVISLLRVLLSDKSIIILDEPSNDIDYLMFNKIYELISFFSKQKIIIIISHDDRFDQYIKKYEIRKKKLCLIEDRDTTTSNNIEVVSNNTLKTIKEKKQNLVFYYCFFLCLVIVIYSMWNSLEFVTTEEPYLKYDPGTYHISSYIGTNISEFNDNDSLDTSLIKAASKWNKLEYIQKTQDHNKILEVGLHFKVDTYKDVYPLQFYNTNDKSYLNVTDKMEEIILSSIKTDDISIHFLTSIDEVINAEKVTKPKVYLPNSFKNINIIKIFEKYGYEISYDNHSNRVISLDYNLQLYSDALKQIGDTNDILVEAIILLENDAEFSDFIIANHLDKQSFLIQGYALYHLNQEINNFNNWVILIKSLLLYLTCIIGLLWIIISIYERANSNRYKVLYYYGFSFSEIEKHQSRYYRLNQLLNFAGISSLFSGFIVYKYFQSCMIIVIFIIYLVIIHCIILLIKHNMKRNMRSFIK